MCDQYANNSVEQYDRFALRDVGAHCVFNVYYDRIVVDRMTDVMDGRGHAICRCFNRWLREPSVSVCVIYSAVTTTTTALMVDNRSIDQFIHFVYSIQIPHGSQEKMNTHKK